MSSSTTVARRAVSSFFRSTSMSQPALPLTADLPLNSVPRPVISCEERLPPIFVADDDEDDLFFIERLIRKTGIPVRTFTNGSHLLNFFHDAQLATPSGRLRCPRLMFLDLETRGLGGFDFLDWTRQQKELKSLTIVVLSNSAAPAYAARALELGAHRYLVKYPSAQTISTIVHSVYPVKSF
jgi:CheY-like chemotaxis protein